MSNVLILAISLSNSVCSFLNLVLLIVIYCLDKYLSVLAQDWIVFVAGTLCHNSTVQHVNQILYWYVFLFVNNSSCTLLCVLVYFLAVLISPSFSLILSRAFCIFLLRIFHPALSTKICWFHFLSESTLKGVLFCASIRSSLLSSWHLA